MRFGSRVVIVDGMDFVVVSECVDQSECEMNIDDGVLARK